MKIDSAANRTALESESVVNEACAARIRDYISRAGLSVPDFARRIGYGQSSVQLFLRGRYHNVAGTARWLVAKADEFMHQHPVEPPTRIQGEIYDTANVRAIRDTFEKLLPRPVAYMLYAPPGSQKSFVLEHQVAELNRAELANAGGRRAFYVYARAHIRPRDLVRRVAVAVGSRVHNDIDPMLASMRFEYRHQRVLLVIDEAQHLDIDCFETLRELLDQPPHFSLLFSGSHDLKRKFDEFSATLEQWNSRLIAKVRLPGLERAEAHQIIRRELGSIFEGMEPRKASDLAEQLVRSATVRDVFEANRTYINIRTLTNALDQIKAAAAPASEAEAEKEQLQ